MSFLLAIYITVHNVTVSLTKQSAVLLHPTNPETYIKKSLTHKDIALKAQKTRMPLKRIIIDNVNVVFLVYTKSHNYRAQFFLMIRAQPCNVPERNH